MKSAWIIFMVIVIVGASITAIAELQDAEPILADTEQQTQRDIVLEPTTPNETAEETNKITADAIAEETSKEEVEEKISFDQVLIQRLLTKEQQEELASLPKDPLQAIELAAKRLTAQQVE